MKWILGVVVLVIGVMVGCDNERSVPLMGVGVSTGITGERCDNDLTWCEEDKDQYRCIDGWVVRVGKCATIIF